MSVTVVNPGGQGAAASLITGIMQMLQQNEERKRQNSAMQLSTLLELGGSPDPGAIESIAGNLGMNPSILTSIMKTKGSFAPGDTDENAIPVTSKYFPNASERAQAARVAGIGAEAQATAEAGAATEPTTTRTAMRARTSMLPVLKQEKQQDLDLQFAEKQKEIDAQFISDVKKSEKITIPEHKAMAIETLSKEKELLTSRLESEKTLEKYKRTLAATPTPAEQSAMDVAKAHITYYNSQAEYNKTIRGMLAQTKAADKDFINILKTHTQFVKDNDSKFHDKGKGGKITPHEYTPGSQEEKDFIASMDAAGVKYQKSTSSHWNIMGGDKDIFIPVAPEIPKETSVEGAMNIKSASKTSITLGNGKVVKRNPDGTVTINGKNYQVEED